MFIVCWGFPWDDFLLCKSSSPSEWPIRKLAIGVAHVEAGRWSGPSGSSQSDWPIRNISVQRDSNRSWTWSELLSNAHFLIFSCLNPRLCVSTSSLFVIAQFSTWAADLNEARRSLWPLWFSGAERETWSRESQFKLFHLDIWGQWLI